MNLALSAIGGAVGSATSTIRVARFLFAMIILGMGGNTASRDYENGHQGLALFDAAVAVGSASLLTFAKTPTGRADVEGFAGAIRKVNPNYPAPGFTNNCVNCAIATDNTLAGYPTSAMPSEAQPLTVLESYYGTMFQSVDSIGEIEGLLRTGGSGSRGIVYEPPVGGKIGHVYNAVNQNGTIRFLDGQAGEAATTHNRLGLQFLRIN